MGGMGSPNSNACGRWERRFASFERRSFEVPRFDESMPDQLDIQQRDRELFNRIAGQYAAKDLNPVSSRPRRHRFLRAMRPYLEAGTVFEDMLDVGCGIGA